MSIHGKGEVNNPNWNEYKDNVKTIIIEEGIEKIIDGVFNQLKNVSKVVYEGTDLIECSEELFIDNPKVYAISLEEDYKNSFGALFDKVKAELTADKTTQELDAILELFKLSLEQCVKNTKTAVDRVKEFNESLDFSKLTKESKLQVERLFSVALEQMASFDGGAPSLDYIFYQLTLNVNFYFV